MGERRSGGRSPGRRHVHPSGTVPGPAPASAAPRDEAALEALLATLLRAGDAARDADDRGGEQRAVAAFRAARAAGTHRARTRRRDDWRPRRRRLGSHSVKALLGVLLGGLTLSGVAVAGIGTPGSGQHTPADRDRTGPAPAAPPTGRPASGTATAPETPTSADPTRPAPAQDTEAHCRAHEQLRGKGRALEATAWQRLLTAAGGEENVDAYCARQTGEEKEQTEGEEKEDKQATGPAPATKGPASKPTGANSGDSGADSGEPGAGSGDRGTPGRPDEKTP